MSIAIRPDLGVLRRLPTIHQVFETWGRLELKWETADTRYWLTTEGVNRRSEETPVNYVIDYITVEKKGPDGHWDLKAVYSPEAWKLFQGFDYCQMLQRDLHVLEEKLNEKFSWEVRKEIEKTQMELNRVNRIVFELSERVWQSWK